jgi:hypothetical protein
MSYRLNQFRPFEVRNGSSIGRNEYADSLYKPTSASSPGNTISRLHGNNCHLCNNEDGLLWKLIFCHGGVLCGAVRFSERHMLVSVPVRAKNVIIEQSPSRISCTVWDHLYERRTVCFICKDNNVYCKNVVKQNYICIYIDWWDVV